jgi:titin
VPFIVAVQPDAPTSLVATPGNARASIAFTAPASDGSVITNYEYSTDNGVTWKALSPVDVTTPVLITIRSDASSALVNGTAYNVKLRAVNSAGQGTVSAAVSVTPRTTAGAPTSLVATPGNAQASIAFTAPASNGGAAITNYEYSTDNGVTWKALSPVDVTTPVVITIRSDGSSALVNGTAYNVKLRAVNSAGQGTVSAAVSVTPSQTAGAPTSLVATPGNARASIAFTAPASDGIAVITNYAYSTDNGVTWKALSPVDVTTPVLITIRSDASSALVNGTAYNVKLRAVNSAGQGTVSAAVSVTPRQTAAPTSLVATPGNARASIAFTAPASDGVVISNYVYSTDNGVTWKALSPVDVTTPVVITIRSDASSALVNGTAYNVKLRAVNSAGQGTVSAAVSVTPRTTAGAPTSLVATPGNARASIAFTAPASDGGAVITNYEYSTNNGVTWKAFSPVDATTPVVITIRSDASSALVNGSTYKVLLRAVNAAGSGTASTMVSVTPR